MSFIGTLVRATATILVAALLAVSVGASPAHARWLKAESGRFIVYSEGGQSELTTFVQKLETFDRVLRNRMGLPADEAPHRKLPIYLVEPSGGLSRLSPGIGSGVAGIYIPRDEDIFAVANRGGMGDDVLLHEYAHHFMLQNYANSYPAWFVEGFAEYFGTVDIQADKIVVGNFNRNRGDWLRNSSWLMMSELLGKRMGQVRDHEETYYPLAWLLTHWFMGTPERHSQLNAYLLEVSNGGNPVEAMPRATGMSNAHLRRELRGYMSRLPYYSMPNTFPPVPVEVTTLPPSADDLLILAQRLKMGVAENRRAATAAEVRRMAARHPNDPFARLTLAHAEIHFGDRATGETLLRSLIDGDPQNLEALQYLAASLLERSNETEDAAAKVALRAEAQRLLARAYALDEANYRTFMLLGDVRHGAPGYPTENDIVTRELALQLAPQLTETRMEMAETYLAAGRNADAIRAALSVANNPHGGESATKAQELITRARGLTEEQVRAEEAAADAAGAEEEDGE